MEEDDHEHVPLNEPVDKRANSFSAPLDPQHSDVERVSSASFVPPVEPLAVAHT